MEDRPRERNHGDGATVEKERKLISRANGGEPLTGQDLCSSADLGGITIVAIHAHPDDESIWTGLLLANARRRGARVHVVTCTLGEEGEVIGEKYQSLQADGNGMLGGYRIAELQRALDALGLEQDPHLLGGVGTWRDSGMIGTPSIQRPDAFANENDEHNKTVQTAQLVATLQELTPDILVTYGPDGGYGHPDHVRAHRITHAAVNSGQLPSVKQILWAVTERSKVYAGLDGAVVPDGWSYPREGDVAMVDSEQVDFVLHGSREDVAAKQRAMAAHATQVWVADGTVTDVNPHARTVPAGTPVLWCLSNLIAQPIISTESYEVGYTAEGVSQRFAEELLHGDVPPRP
ncbi:N-acetyl-1-D-myo-inositol-2-amino-2-deoxy-alpha-D-glucopyranoside deacetylase [Corynebacterium sp. 4HC-13]|nr:N-acetyl-1-D-myo-inositol-2-amino-2-deoxy-alpha-D-glucopyranoside deacetylase [Corynebacterium anserum]